VLTQFWFVLGGVPLIVAEEPEELMLSQLGKEPDGEKL
jgi:hypothetical protein